VEKWNSEKVKAAPEFVVSLDIFNHSHHKRKQKDHEIRQMN